MKTLLSHAIFILLVRVLLGGLFIVASLDKFGDTNAFAVSILNYKVIGPTLASIIATILPSLEFLCGLCLILGLYPRASATVITLMLVGFTILVFSAIVRGLDISCGCFTQDPSAGKIGYYKILENTGLIILGVYLMVINSYGIVITQFFPHQRTKQKNNPIS